MLLEWKGLYSMLGKGCNFRVRVKVEAKVKVEARVKGIWHNFVDLKGIPGWASVFLYHIWFIFSLRTF